MHNAYQEISFSILCVKDLGVDILAYLLPESHSRRIVKETNCLLTNVRKAFKDMDKEAI